MKSKHLLQIVIMLTLLISSFASQANVLVAHAQDASPSAHMGIYNSILDWRNLNPVTIRVGSVIPFAISLENVPATGYASAEFTCQYDPTLVDVYNFTDLGLFGPDAVSVANGPDNGQFIFAIAGSNGNKATTSGAVVRFNIKAVTVGQFNFNCSVRVSPGDETLIDIPFTPLVTNVLLPPPPATITGKVITCRPITVAVFDADGNLITSTTTDPANGTFNMTVLAGTYSISAKAPGFIGAQAKNVVLASGQTLNLPETTLIAGDIDSNNQVDVYDAITIGANYNSYTPTAADLNCDNVINVLDLQILAAHYRLLGPTIWH
jgi:hypothetical protein